MNEWIGDLAGLATAGERVVVVTIAGVRGSAPREPGAKMLVTATETIGTIGGGQLEYRCTRVAVDMLGDTDGPVTRRFPLGSAMGQCCGGVVDVLFEPLDAGMPRWLDDLSALHRQRQPVTLVTGIASATKAVVTGDDILAGQTPPASVVARARAMTAGSPRAVLADGWFLEAVTGSDFDIAVFGAGHVGTEVVAALARLDTNIRWVDNRRDVFRATRANVSAIETRDPALEVAAMPPGSFYLVMTHSHALDFDICSRILARGDAAYCGLIGSRTKRRRFEKRFRAQGLADAAIESLVCPIGVGGISGKKPAEIAIAAAAELLRTREAGAQRAGTSLRGNVRPIRGS